MEVKGGTVGVKANGTCRVERQGRGGGDTETKSVCKCLKETCPLCCGLNKNAPPPPIGLCGDMWSPVGGIV